jgi:hypothetical protein
VKVGQAKRFEMRNSNNRRNLNKIFQFLIVFGLVLGMLSCTKEKEPVALIEVQTASFDSGYLIIKLLDNPSFLDSICYFNHTKGTSFKINKTDFYGFNSDTNPIVSISRPLNSGTLNDEVECCFYLNTPMEIGVAFKNKDITAIPTILSGSSPEICIAGNY